MTTSPSERSGRPRASAPDALDVSLEAADRHRGQVRSSHDGYASYGAADQAASAHLLECPSYTLIPDDVPPRRRWSRHSRAPEDRQPRGLSTETEGVP